MPVACLCKFFFNDVADQEYLAPAQKFADDKGGERRNKPAQLCRTDLYTAHVDEFPAADAGLADPFGKNGRH